MNDYNISISEYYELYEEDLKKILEHIQKCRSQGLPILDLKAKIGEADKCLKQMESELTTLPQSLRKKCNLEIAKYRLEYNFLNQKLTNIVQKNPPISSTSEQYDEQQQGLLDCGNDMLENADIIDDMEKMTNETEYLASNVNGTLASGTRALANAKTSRSELKSHLQKADLTINMMNRKVIVDKLSMYIIVILLALIDILALYMKLL